MRSEIWNPVREPSGLHRGIDRLFEEMLAPLSEPFSETERRWGFSPACDVEETETHYLASIDLPGVSREDIRIELLDNRLMVSGERKSETRDNGSRRVVERFHGAFQRMFALPVAVDPNKVEASYQDGVLRIAIPKTEEAKPRQIRVSDGKPSGLFEKLFGGKEKNMVETSKGGKVA